MTDLQAFIIPLTKQNDIWSFIHPYTFNVWICVILSVPSTAIAWMLINFLITGKTNYSSVLGFLMRNILVDHGGQIPNSKAYEKALVFGWVWFAFILTCVYAGNLMALITRPTIDMPIWEPESILEQDEILWVMEDETVNVDYVRRQSLNDTLHAKWRKIYDRVELLNPSLLGGVSGCFSKETMLSGRHASLCDDNSIKYHLHREFTKKGQCDWYVSKWFTLESTNLVLVFPVIIEKVSPWFLCRKT